MDDTNNTNASAGTPIPVGTGGQVMDIQASRPFATSAATTVAAPVAPVDIRAPEDTESSEEPVFKLGSAGASAIEPATGSAPAFIATPQTETASSSSEFSPTISPTAGPAQSGQDTSNHLPVSGEPTELGVPPPEHHKSGSPIIAITIAIVVAVGVAGVVVFMYLKSSNAKKATTNTTSGSSSQVLAPKPQASANDVTTTTKELDTGLSQVDETKDFSANELSDASLGL